MSPEDVKKRLHERYPDSQIVVNDLTGTQNHYEVSVLSSQFDGLSRIERHKSVMGAFDEELKSGEVHALTIRAKTPEEVQ